VLTGAMVVPAAPSSKRGSALRRLAILVSALPPSPPARAGQLEQPGLFQLCVSANVKNINVEWAGGTNNS